MFWLLAEYWLPKEHVDKLSCYVVSQLYAHGFDFFAASRIHKVQTKQALGESLLEIASARLSETALKANLEASLFLSPNLAYWLRTISEKKLIRYNQFSQESIKNLLGHVSNMLPKTHKHYQFYREIVELLPKIK